MKKTTKEMLNCHYCNAEKSVLVKDTSSKDLIGFDVGKCSFCKKQNTFKLLMKYNNK